MALKFQLDNISPDGSGYVAYIEMQDDSGIIIARRCVPYSDDEQKFQTSIAEKFVSAISKHNEKEAVAAQAAAVITSITAAKIAEVTTATKTESKKE